MCSRVGWVPFASKIEAEKKHLVGEAPRTCIMSDAKSTASSQRDFLEREGYAIFRNLIPPEIVKRARAAIDEARDRGEDPGGAFLHGEEDAVSDIWNKTSLPKVVSSLAGGLRQDGMKLTWGQVALVNPGYDCERKGDRWVADPSWGKRWHIDGLHNKFNEEPPAGEIHGFTALVGVLLSDIDEPLSGELVVHPGSHNHLARLYGRNKKNYELLREKGWDALDTAFKEQREGKWGAPAHFTGKAGDVVLANYWLAHTVAPNRSKNIRYAIYFRLHTSLLKQELFWKYHRPIAFAIPFHDWAGLASSCKARRAGRPDSECTCLADLQLEPVTHCREVGPATAGKSVRDKCVQKVSEACLLI